MVCESESMRVCVRMSVVYYANFLSSKYLWKLKVRFRLEIPSHIISLGDFFKMQTAFGVYILL